MTDVKAWMKRLSRKGPFYLFAVTPFRETINRIDGSVIVKEGNRYTVIWQDGEKTKIGGLSDHMWCRYGIGTRAAVIGDRPQDLWRGDVLEGEEIEAMLAVRNGNSNLREFKLTELQNLSH